MQAELITAAVTGGTAALVGGVLVGSVWLVRRLPGRVAFRASLAVGVVSGVVAAAFGAAEWCSRPGVGEVSLNNARNAVAACNEDGKRAAVERLTLAAWQSRDAATVPPTLPWPWPPAVAFGGAALAVLCGVRLVGDWLDP
jgi:hypothetical protein